MEIVEPNEKEIEVLTLFYNRFYDLYDEIVNDNFHIKNANIRFIKLREAFSVYKELLNYEPIKAYVQWMKNGGRPPLEGIIAYDVFSFIRNLLMREILDKQVENAEESNIKIMFKVYIPIRQN